MLCLLSSQFRSEVAFVSLSDGRSAFTPVLVRQNFLYGGNWRNSMEGRGRREKGRRTRNRIRILTYFHYFRFHFIIYGNRHDCLFQYCKPVSSTCGINKVFPPRLLINFSSTIYLVDIRALNFTKRGSRENGAYFFVLP